MIAKSLCIKEALVWGTNALSCAIDVARREAEILLQHSLQVSRAYLYTHDEAQLSHAAQNKYQEAIQQRRDGRPVAYIIGQRDFWTLRVPVTPATLIPRPETELLVEVALAELAPSANLSVLDLGTGSGAIAVALASERPHWQIIASDKEKAALESARAFAEDLNLHHIQFICADWFIGLKTGPLHAIVSNPPYLSETDPHLQQGDLRFEPRTALVSGQSGLEALDWIIKQSYALLQDGGILLLEHGYDQAANVTRIFKEQGYTAIQSWQDTQGHDRVTGGRRPIQSP